MSTKAQAKTQAKTSVAPAAAHIPQPPVAEPEHEAEWPDIAARLEGAARLGHRLGAVGVDAPPPIIQRQEIPEEEEELRMMLAPAGEVALQRQAQPEEEEELMLKRDDQRVGPQGGQVSPELEAAIHRARGGGQPLEPSLQAHMSEALGHDFSRVRLHTDSEADALNQRLSARAFTTGQDIFFRQGEYNPGSGAGRELIAHELTHVVQQGTGRVTGGCSGTTVRPTGDAFEQEADAVSKWKCNLSQRGGQQRAADQPAMANPAAILALQRSWGNKAEHGTLKSSLGPGMVNVIQRDPDENGWLYHLCPIGVVGIIKAEGLKSRAARGLKGAQPGGAFAKDYEKRLPSKVKTRITKMTKRIGLPLQQILACPVSNWPVDKELLGKLYTQAKLQSARGYDQRLESNMNAYRSLAMRRPGVESKEGDRALLDQLCETGGHYLHKLAKATLEVEFEYEAEVTSKGVYAFGSRQPETVYEDYEKTLGRGNTAVLRFRFDKKAGWEDDQADWRAVRLHWLYKPPGRIQMFSGRNFMDKTQRAKDSNWW